MIVVDASVWVSYFWPLDVHHTASRAWVGQYLAGGERMVAPLLLVPEVGGPLSRRTGQPALGRRAVHDLLRLPTLRWVLPDTRLYLHAARLAGDMRLRGADAVYVAVAERLNVPLVSWDNEHLTRAAAQIAVYTPKTLP